MGPALMSGCRSSLLIKCVVLCCVVFAFREARSVGLGGGNKVGKDIKLQEHQAPGPRQSPDIAEAEGAEGRGDYYCCLP